MKGYLRDKPDVPYWIGEIRRGMSFRKRFAHETMWPVWRAYYRGDFREGILPLNLFFKMIRTMVPRVYFRNPSISIQPAKPGFEYMVLAQLLERIDNKLITRMGVKRQMKRMIQDAFLFGTGIGKRGFGALYTPSPDILDTSDPGDKKGYRTEYHNLVSENTPWWLRTHPGHFIVPAGAADWESARWCCHVVKRDIEDVKADPRLKNTAAIQPTRPTPMQINRRASAGEQADDEQIELWEIRDKKTGLVFVIAPYVNGEKALMTTDDEMQVDGKLPYDILQFNEDDEVFWGVPDAKILDPQQREANELRTLVMKHRRLSLLKILIEKGAMVADSESSLLDEDEVLGIVRLLDGGLQKIKIEAVGDIPAGLIKGDAMLQQDVQEMMGFGSNQFGEYAPGSADRSATEANIVQMATQIRTDERRDTVADLLVDIVTGVNHVVFSRWTEEQIIDIAGPAGVKIWISFQPEILKRGNYETSIDPDSSIPHTKQYREQRAMGLYKELKLNPLIHPLKLTQYLLHEIHGTQFDGMIVGGPDGAMMGSPQQPIPANDYIKALPQLQQSVQRAMLSAGGGQGGGPGGGAPPTQR